MTSTTRPAPKLKVGDKVRINANGPRLYWVHTMDKFIINEVIGVINQEQYYDPVVGSYTYHLKAYEGYSVSEQDLELVEEAVPSSNTNARPDSNARKHAFARPHADLIIAWAKGAEIECYNDIENTWYSVEYPSWHQDSVYRIKPEEPTVVPVEFFMRINAYVKNSDILNIGYSLQQTNVVNHNVKATVDKNTGKLLSIEMIKA